jgi:hypothetical protein
MTVIDGQLLALLNESDRDNEPAVTPVVPDDDAVGNAGVVVARLLPDDVIAERDAGT